ncbi:MAG: FlgO family outer membrane protein [Elusimicrobiota bacterium]
MICDRKIVFSGALVGLLIYPFPSAFADPYDRLAEQIRLIAKRSGAKRVTVLPFLPVTGGAKDSGVVLSERLVSRLAGQGELAVVERTLLDEVLKEQQLGHKGVIDPKQTKEVGRVLGVNALITGTFLSLSDDEVEVHVRLIDAETARILGAAMAKVKKEWEEDWLRIASTWDVQPEVPDIFPAPTVRLIPDPFRDAVADNRDSCSGWEERADALQAGVLEVKARHWATRLRDPGFSRESLTRNPGSEIRNIELRQWFFRRTKEIYREGYADGITMYERSLMESADGKAERLAKNCY